MPNVEVEYFHLKRGRRGGSFWAQVCRTEKAPKARSYPAYVKSCLRFTSIFVTYLAHGIGLFTDRVFAHSLLEVALWVRLELVHVWNLKKIRCLMDGLKFMINCQIHIVECTLTQKKLIYTYRSRT